jgi:DNA-binding response OmpR family regulator
VTDRSCVLVIDDDDTVREVLRRYLTRDGHDVLEAADGTTGLELALTHNPDLLVLDLMLPGMDGLEVCRRLRQRSTVPIIMLTALGQVSDRVVGLEYGADDYVVKPFSPRELALRVGRVLDRSMGAVGPIPPPGELRTADGELAADAASRIASCRGHEISLTSREFDLLYFLLRHPGRVFGRAELMEKVWGWSFGDQSTVTVHVRRLREKIEIDPANPLRIVTVWGVGYRLEPGTAGPGGPAGPTAGRTATAGSHGVQQSPASATPRAPDTLP